MIPNKDEYADQLAVELADYLTSGSMAKAGGLLLLTDAYCSFNRARGLRSYTKSDNSSSCFAK